MFSKSIKTNIAVSIALLLLISMILIDFIMINISLRGYIKTQIDKGQVVASILKEKIRLDNAINNRQIGGHFIVSKELINTLNSEYITIIINRNETVLYAGKGKSFRKEVNECIYKSIEHRKVINQMIGKSWGLLGEQHKYLIVAIPISVSKSDSMGIGFIFSLKDFYEYIRKSQQLVLIYIIINTIIFAIVGFFQMNKLILKPINRLSKRAKEYTGDEGADFLIDQKNNEIGLLSRSLNHMIMRISEDKEKLRSSLISIEKANFELHKAHDEILRAEKLASIGRLSAGIAHEIGNPIGIVLGYLELLRQRDITETDREDYIDRSENEINRINQIIRQLLDFSRSSNDITKNVDIHEIIYGIVTILEVQPLMENINLKLDLKAADKEVFGEPDKLKQVFLNLLMNSADAIAMSKNDCVGEIKIITEVEKGPLKGQDLPLLKIKIVDNGYGIPQENLNTVFDHFYTTKEPGKGTGLGLSVCFMIVEQMGGTIEAGSELGKGTTLTITLPIKK